eukprot:CAMPEP_0195032650 /NCGR_PEP_ID=MMETSP0326_2-20130528/63955_1 /TAXON_ID=2866 ORGANISM="Crypthecodinium cohnii, Strain Seligo" /NCGR_SAMPLE_ID=MMETSP0326_2 /ASSEMBLY_ACC=CAM_ASM_000348 /LENGTH=40 /DNA_ID= /DNA_START= /DNA_END= /DNA_ORIENTATION=
MTTTESLQRLRMRCATVQGTSTESTQVEIYSTSSRVVAIG